MKTISILGRFHNIKMPLNGQTIKTKIFTKELKKTAKNYKYIEVDTSNWNINIFKIVMSTLKIFIKSDFIIVMPASRGIKIIAPLYTVMNMFFHKKLIYVVVGGQLPIMTKRVFFKLVLKRFDYIFVETKYMLDELNRDGLFNIHILRNFKSAEDSFVNIVDLREREFKFVMVSRIVPEKGIEDAINVVNELIRLNPNSEIKLHIYGQIDDSYYKNFTNLISQSNDNIQYKGYLEYSNVYKSISEYDMLLFPTKFKTEGIPGTIIDAFFAGIPVLVSKWNSAEELIKIGVTGDIFNFNDLNDFTEKLQYYINNKDKLYSMRENCIKESKKYLPENVIIDFINKVGFEIGGSDNHHG